MSPFQIISPKGPEVPIVLSVPHCGTLFPPELIDQFEPDLIRDPDDTDWFVHQLYDFTPSMGITLVHAQYSRWVIDLNRHPDNEPLYSDGRHLTGLCPVTTFTGQKLYRDQRPEVSATEVDRRVATYYTPYHDALERTLTRLRQKFGSILLWECHSIRQFVPTLSKQRIPDLILGDADGTSASPELIECALQSLESGEFLVKHNLPFKGGYITRQFGRPQDHQHVLQLEMAKVLYMDDHEKKYDVQRAGRIRVLLKRVFINLIDQLADASFKIH